MKGNKNVKGDSATPVSGGILTQGVNVRKPANIGVSRNVPSGDSGTNSGSGRRGMGK